MITRFVALGALVLALVMGTVAQDTKAYDKTKSGAKKEAASKEVAKTLALQGYVVDAMCAKRMAGKENTMAKAAAHTKGCALEENCQASGFGMFSDGKWYKFDKAGDEKALAWLESTELEKSLMADVTGTMSGNLLAVNTLKEHKADTEKKVETDDAHKDHKH